MISWIVGLFPQATQYISWTRWMSVDSLTEAFAEDVQDTDNFYQRIISSDEEDFGDPDDGTIADNDGHPGLTPVCQTLFCDPRDVLDTVDVDSVTGGFVEKLPGTDDIYHELVSSEEEDFSEAGRWIH